MTFAILALPNARSSNARNVCIENAKPTTRNLPPPSNGHAVLLSRNTVVRPP